MKIIIDNYPYHSISIPQGNFKHLKIGDNSYFSLTSEKPTQKTMKFVKENEILYLSNKLTDYTWNFEETYGQGYQNQVKTGTVTTDYCLSCVIHFTSTPMPNASHRGNDRATNANVTVRVINQEDEIIYEDTTTLWTYTGGDNRGNVDKDLDILNQQFDEPVKIIFEYSIDIGGYVAHINGGQNWCSVVDNMKIKITCDGQEE